MRWVLLVAPFHRWRNWGMKRYMTYPVTQLGSHRAGIWIGEDFLTGCLTASEALWTDPSLPALIIGFLTGVFSSAGPSTQQAPKAFIIIIVLHDIHQVQVAWMYSLKYTSFLVISLLKSHRLSISPGSHVQLRVLWSSPLSTGLSHVALGLFPLCTLSLSTGNHLSFLEYWIILPALLLFSEAVLSAVTILPLLVGHSCSSFQSHFRYCLLWGALLEPSLPPSPIRVDSLLRMHRALTVHVIVTNMSSLVGSDNLKGSRGFHCSFLSLAPTTGVGHSRRSGNILGTSENCSQSSLASWVQWLETWMGASLGAHVYQLQDTTPG